MAKGGNGKPGPSAIAENGGAKGKGRPNKVIQKTIDLIKGNEKRKDKGKGKEKEALGDLAKSVEGMYSSISERLSLASR